MKLLSFMAGGFASGLVVQVGVMCGGNAVCPPDVPREYLLVDTPVNRAAVERADREERRALAAESEVARLAVEVAVLRERLKLVVPNGVEAEGERIPATALPVQGERP